MDVSVIIPCLNRESFIDEAIQSALGQGEDVEVIVVDDGSTDGTWDRLLSYGNRIVAMKGEGRGPSAARNLGLAVAQGRYAHFLDSDDRLASGALAVMLEAASKLGPKEIAVGDAVNIDEVGNSIEGAQRGYAGLVETGEIPRATILERPMSTPLPLFPAADLRRLGGFDERLRHMEDRELTVRLLAAGYGFARVPRAVCEVRHHGEGRLSSSGGDAAHRHALTALKLMNGHLANDPVFKRSPQEQIAFARLCWSVARAAARARQRPAANELFALASSIAGTRARVGSRALQLFYRVMPPYPAERLLQAIKGRSADA